MASYATVPLGYKEPARPFAHPCPPAPSRRRGHVAAATTSPTYTREHHMSGGASCAGARDSQDAWAGARTIDDCTGRCAMPYGGNDWLGLTEEDVLEPELP